MTPVMWHLPRPGETREGFLEEETVKLRSGTRWENSLNEALGVRACVAGLSEDSAADNLHSEMFPRFLASQGLHCLETPGSLTPTAAGGSVLAPGILWQPRIVSGTQGTRVGA